MAQENDNAPGSRDFYRATLLFIATLSAQLSNQWYLAWQEQRPLFEFLLPSLVFLSMLTLPAILVGMKLAPSVGLSLSSGHARHNLGTRKILSIVVSSMLLGCILVGIRYLVVQWLPPEVPELGFRGIVGGLLVSIGAAIGEEVWFRFGLMTLLLFGIKKLFKKTVLTSTTALAVIILCSVGFALAHLPQMFSYGANTQIAIGATMLGNIAVGILYGWLYWRCGLLAAIISHFSVDLILHVVTAIPFT